MRDPRYDILFEEVKIGPVTAKNRFYQVPHCNGMGHVYPKAIAASRGVKAEGGWSVIATEECEIHPSSDVSPYNEARLWDEGDMKRLQLSVDAIHEHGALAAVEITHNGHHSINRYSRLPVMGVSDMPVGAYDPAQAYAMGKKDFVNLRKMHRDAAIRARDTGFDIIYVYAGHDLALPFHFLSRRHNRRTDEYGGSLENRVRLLKEMLIETKETVGDKCGIAIRLAVDELIGEDGICAEDEGRDIVEMLAELPDLWDVNIADWSNDSITARFGGEAFQEQYTKFVKDLTSKPVVGVGRFTSPDAMVSQIKRGVLDMIGAARPSIADPFLPKKIENGELEDIRECIGCNICVSSDMVIHPLRCTQNPTTAEEYRRGWHPEKVNPSDKTESVLIIGAGPAGLEAAHCLGKRGHQVMIAESADEAGGRVLAESRLPGLSTWKRVVDYRLGQIEKLDNVSLHLQSHLNKEQIQEICQEMGVSHIALATGSTWRSDGIGRAHHKPIPQDNSVTILNPNQIMEEEFNTSEGAKVVVYDDDHYYMGNILAEKLATAGCQVTLVTPAAQIATWTENTLEQDHIEKRLLSLGVNIVTKHTLQSIANGKLILQRLNSNQTMELSIDACVMVTLRKPTNDLYRELVDDEESPILTGIKSVTRIGDCLAPSTIANAVYEGHRYGREFGENIDPLDIPFKRERIEI